MKVAGKFYDFRAPWMIEYGGGYKVFCRFDPAEPTRGAAIYNRESGASNFNGHKPAQFIGFAQWEMPAPSVDVTGAVRGIIGQSVEDFYGEGALDQGDTLRKKQEKLVATAFSAFPRPGQPAVKMNEARDGEGRVARVETSVGRASPRADVVATDDTPRLAPVQRTTRAPRNIFTPSTPDEFQRRRAALAKQAKQARNLQEAT